MSIFAIAVDGASKGNPGAAGIGVVVYNGAGEIVTEISEYIGTATNNVAEYSALIRGLEEVLALGGTQIRVSTDSELMVKQIVGLYRVKSPHLVEYYQRAKSLLAQFKSAKIRHVPREENSLADKLASSAAIARRNAPKKSDVKPTAGKEYSISRIEVDTNPLEEPQQDMTSQMSLWE